MAYKVLNYFEDLLDDGHKYRPGDEFPRNGMKVSQRRLEELSSDKNLRGVKLIEAEAQAEPKVEAKAEPKAEKPKAEAKKRSRKTK